MGIALAPCLAAAEERGQVVEAVLDHAFTLRAASAQPMALSPDGRWLAVTVRGAHDQPLPERPRRARLTASVTENLLGSAVLVIDTDSGTITQPFPRSATSWAPAWSPDGKFLAVFASLDGTPCLAVWDVARQSYRPYREAAVLGRMGSELPCWTADGAAIVVQRCQDSAASSTPQTLNHQPGEQQKYTYTSWHEPQQSLVRVESARGTTATLCQHSDAYEWRVAPGRHVSWLRQDPKTNPAAATWRRQLVLAALDGSGERIVAGVEDHGLRDNSSWSPNGRFLATIVQDAGQARRLFCIPSDGSAAVECKPPSGRHFGARAAAAFYAPPPRWRPDGKSFAVLFDDRVLFYGLDGKLLRTLEPIWKEKQAFTWLAPPADSRPIGDEAEWLLTRRGVYRLDLNSAKVTEAISDWPAAFQPQHELLGDRALAGDARALYFLSQTPQKAVRICRADLAQGSVRLLAELSAGYEKKALGTFRKIDWRTPDGRACQGALLLPRNYVDGTKLPAIVEVYAGDVGNGRWHLGNMDEQCMLNPHALAAAGYAVFKPDLPLNDEYPARQIPGLVKAATDRIVALGYADPQRIGLMGNSYGAYTVLSVLTQTHAYRAAIAANGTSDLVRIIGDGGFSWAERGQGRMGGSLWERRQAYLDNSPYYALDRIATPILLVRGGADPMVDGHLEGTYDGLARLDKRAELRVYPGQGHWPGTWTRQGQRDLARRAIAWFDEHLASK